MTTLDRVSARYGIRIDSASQLGGGIESTILRIGSDRGEFVVRVSPTWRTVAELAWAYELASFAATEIPEALAPIPAVDGTLVFEHGGHVVSVFPYVSGATLARTNDRERDSAASLLARLHRVLPAWPNARARPASRANAPMLVPFVEPLGIEDAALDATVARLGAECAPALSHGDYYRGNVRCVNERIVAVFDWDDAGYWTHENELAWSVWEFAQADDSATLDLDRARRFLDVYSAQGGRVPLGDVGFIIPFIRDDIRAEIREAVATAEQRLAFDPVYQQRSFEAFKNLADLKL